MTRRLVLSVALAIAGAIVLAAFWQRWAFHTFVVDPELEQGELTRGRVGNLAGRVARAAAQGLEPAAVGAAVHAPGQAAQAPPADAPMRLRTHGVTLHIEQPTPAALWITAVDGARVVRVGPIPLDGRPDALWWILGTVALVVGLLAALLVAVPLARSLDRLAAAARRIAGGDLSARAAVRRGPGRTLADDFNAMAAHNQRLVESQEHLLQAVSHELRTPCARIRFAIEMLETDAEPGQRARRVAGIDQDLDELEGLVDELLTYARARAAGVTAERAPLPVADELARLVADAGGRRAGVAVTVGPVSPALVVHAEARTFRRALRNLLLNAVRYAEGAVVVHAHAEADGVCITVADDGPGIPAADRERVFEPFTRLDPSRSRAGGGVGLGLAIVRRILQLHGGRAWVEADATLGGARVVTRWPAGGATGSASTPGG